MSAVAVGGVHKSFDGAVVLDDVTLDVGDGETVVLLGPSGCGKTTLLRLIAGLDRLDGGTISVGDRVVSGPAVHIAPEHRGVGLVFQDGALFPHLSVGRNIGFGLQRDARRAGPRIDELCELIGLAGAADRQPDELSGGQQQRVALARALAPRPSVLLLDEPFSNLDAVLRERLREQVRDIVTEAETTSVFVTHDRAEAFALADRVALMRDGRIVQTGPPTEVYRRPADRWSAELLGDAVVMAGDADGASVVTAWGTFATVSGSARGSVDVVVRPEDVRLTAAPSGLAGSDRVPDQAAAATVVACQAEGSTWSGTVSGAAGDPIRVRGLGACPWRPADRVEVAIDGPVWTVAAATAPDGPTTGGGRASVPEGHG